MSKYDAGFELSWYDRFKVVCALLPRVGKVLQEEWEMKKYLGILRYLAALAVMAGLLTAGGVKVYAETTLTKDEYLASDSVFKTTESYKLSKNTRIIMDIL